MTTSQLWNPLENDVAGVTHTHTQTHHFLSSNHLVYLFVSLKINRFVCLLSEKLYLVLFALLLSC